MTPIPSNCGNCRHFGEAGQPDGDGHRQGLCLLNPPVLIDVPETGVAYSEVCKFYHWSQPAVRDDCRCSRWQPIE